MAKKKSGRKASKPKVKKSAKSGTKKPTKKRVSKPRKKPSVSIKKIRGKKQIEIGFKNVKSIEKKIDLLNTISDKQINARMQKGKPPKGVIIQVEDSQGRIHTNIAPPDFVVNPRNVKAFVKGITDKMATDHTQWLKGQKKKRTKSKGKKRKWDRSEMYDPEHPMNISDGSGDGEDGYGDFNPDSITNITITFI